MEGFCTDQLLKGINVYPYTTGTADGKVIVGDTRNNVFFLRGRQMDLRANAELVEAANNWHKHQASQRKIGDQLSKPCAKCGEGMYVVYSTHPKPLTGFRTQYFHCNQCHHVPEMNKRVKRLER